ncbi:DNA gyrase subunit A [Mycoplasmopsis arginini]|uniref:DNA gyrase subunit A n=2 Tax=Mycoplasmopsis TaxID=2767358 RepID=A0AA43TW14_MYCAR|nr:DNA gyrase subunit A [Mycoplasmopsis arginini]MDI3348800.1 DNA gyrase subunit A [Mycoplasmopsis arginini]MDI3349313.1 DNA gyrase subunit A [Mycoplasmopsis arginini]MDI3351592.1 DNA gyrase subunit A [Mycoplasmopsis arginini]MDI3352141.1 DNA gyrase subunit A [Mycoplasmopsis arginini]BAQ54524.1 DNA gyrase subunit A [Mycoplasmopsis arginini]
MLIDDDKELKPELEDKPEDKNEQIEDFYIVNDEIQRVFDEEAKEEIVDDEDEEYIPQDKEGYTVQSQILDSEENGLRPADLATVMKNSFLEYAMSVIVARALPDARDGLKPVHRRILYGMSELGMFHNVQHKKSARIVGDVLGKYHPHGDSSVYEAMVRMAQDFSLRYPLIDGHGNFGSIDGDSAAAMRYTEARMSKIAGAMVDGIKKNTVDFIDNYDGTEKEPVVLPSRFPNLLVSGSYGIAVGMATSIPPHNLGEVIDGVCALAKNPDITIAELMQYIQGPDFPTGGIIFDKEGLIRAYETGVGRVTIRSKATIQELSNGKSKILITEIPYGKNKSSLIESISHLIKDKKIEGISDFRDESNRDGIRIVIEIKKNYVPEVILNKLFKLTEFQTRFSFNMVALVNNEPQKLNLKSALEVYLQHQINVVTRRLQFDLEKDLARAHILEGLKICVENIDRVIAIIKQSKTDAEAQKKLGDEFNLTEIQTKAVVDMRLGRLTGLAIEKMNEELNQLHERIAEYRRILGDKNALIDLIIKELQELKEAYGDKRKSEINWEEVSDINNEDLIPRKDVVITVTTNGYLKRLDLDEYKEQGRGGVGVSTAKTYQDDDIQDILVANTHTDLLIFTTDARVYRVRGYEVPIGTKQSKGVPIVNIIGSLGKDEKVVKILSVDDSDYEKEKFLITATKKGIIKKSSLSLYKLINKNGKLAFGLKEGDTLVDALVATNSEEIYIAANNSKMCRFDIADINSMGRIAAGVIGIKLSDNEKVVSVSTSSEGKYIFSLGANGFGKLSPVDTFRKTRRNSKGVLALNEDKAGELAYSAAVKGTEDIIVITDEGVSIRFSLKQVSITGRNTKGVKLINLKKRNSSIVGVAKIVNETEEESQERELTENELKEVTQDIDLDLVNQNLDQNEE